MCDNCEEDLITTSQGPQGEQGVQGEPGTNGTNGVLDWGDFDLSCWLAEGIIEGTPDNEEITQSFIDTFCDIYQAINVTPIAVNDYRTMDQDGIIYIEVINNDRFYPDVTVTIAVAPSNGTATIEPDNKTIKYIPNEGFIGVDDFDYTINDGDSTSTATVSVTVQEVISQQTIQNTVVEQLITLLQSDEYWDLGFQVGDSIIISNNNLDKFDFTNPFTAGKGKNPGRYSKWAIKNGNNGTEDFTQGTFRGFDNTNADYDESAKAGGSDSLSITLAKENIPAHRHNMYVNVMELGDGDTTVQVAIDNLNNTLDDGAFMNIESTPQDGNGGGAGNDLKHRVARYNTGDGTDNLSNQDELLTTPSVIESDIRNAFKTVIVIQKISM